MASAVQINIKPQFKLSKVPCDGTAGDLLVMTSLGEGMRDGSPQGLASLWFCTKSANLKEQQPAVWKMVELAGYATCQMPNLPDPPQNDPPVREG